ncbi:MAG: hypothetical protein N3A61_07465, partial [Ignavibacteria bacterium]|nr:hypothetical protein [Ignavibacteria bacterium]
MKNILIVLISLFLSNLTFSQNVTLDWKIHDVGKVRQVITNTGWLNAKYDATFDYPYLFNCEYPAGTREEHITEGGPWIGAILNGVKCLSLIHI